MVMLLAVTPGADDEVLLPLLPQAIAMRATTASRAERRFMVSPCLLVLLIQPYCVTTLPVLTLPSQRAQRRRKLPIIPPGKTSMAAMRTAPNTASDMLALTCLDSPKLPERDVDQLGR